MISKLFRALRVFIQSLLGTEADERLPEPTPLVPTVAERFGKPLPPPRLEVEAPLTVEQSLLKLRTTFGRDKLDVENTDSGRYARRTQLTSEFA
jgi:hypothetical protein